MSEEGKRIQTLHLKQEDLIGKLPEKIGKVSLHYQHYSGQDLYSDGEIEDELLSIVKNAARIEYPKIIEERGSWPILYHLSSLRGNIVDWLPIDKSKKVLEIGAGCGAITEKLSQKAGKVTCIDLSAKRSHINAYRNQEKDNIEIHVGNFNDIEPELPTDYDFVCLIGVFEYAQSYIPTETPYEDFLKIMLKHTKNNGRIVIAIENKFGLKYWAGCKEDHLGTYYSGLEGYPEGGSARTFTRPGLEQIFRDCGVRDYSFFYPYPDYKFPTAIYSDRRLPHIGELTENIRNFDRDRMVNFNEKYVFDGIIKDGLFPVFSNSYLAVIGKEPESVYVKYSNDRAAAYSLKTEIMEAAGKRTVRKYPLTESGRTHIENMQRSYELLQERYQGSGLKINPCVLNTEEGCAEFPFEKGTTLEELMDHCLEKEDLEGFYRLFDRYYQFISYGEEKKAADYDLIFANILVDGDEWTVIDYEWTMEKQISSKEIAFRAVYCYVLEEEKRNKLNLDLIIEKIGITPQEAEEYRAKEQSFQKQVTGKRKSMGELRAAIGTYCVDPKTLMESHLQKILDRRIQVYYDSGEGFSEAASEYLPDVYVNDCEVETEIPFDGNLKQLRIDPADKPCIVKLKELAVNETTVPFQKKYIQTNGKTVGEGCYVFASSDPNMHIEVTKLPMKGENTLFLKMQVQPLTKELAADMAEAAGKGKISWLR